MSIHRQEGEKEGAASSSSSETKIDPKTWFRQNRILTPVLEEIIDEEGIEIEEFLGMSKATLDEIALNDLKITSTLKRERFIRKIKKLETELKGGVKQVILSENDPDRFKKVKEMARDGQKLDIVLLTKNESRLIAALKKKKADLEKLMKDWVDLNEMRERRNEENLAEQKRMVSQIDSLINELKNRKKEMIEKIKGITQENCNEIQGGLNESIKINEETALAIKEINVISSRGDIPPKQREKQIEIISKGAISASEEVETKLIQDLTVLKNGWTPTLYKFVMDHREWTRKVRECGMIVESLRPIDVSVKDDVIRWKMPMDDEFKSGDDESIQFEVISNGQSVGTSHENTLKIPLKFAKQYSIQVRARLKSDLPWGPLSNPFKFKTVRFDSVLISDFQLYLWLRNQIELKMNGSITTELIYRASRDGWTGANAHDRINGKGATFVLIQNEFGNIYGGFTSVSWTSAGSYKSDENAFIFLLKGNPSILKKYSVKTPRAFFPGGSEKSYAIYDDSSHIASFGSGHDFYTGTNCHTRSDKAYIDFPYTYQLNPSSPSTSQDKCDLLSGKPGATTQHSFKIREIEYFLVSTSQ